MIVRVILLFNKSNLNLMHNIASYLVYVLLHQYFYKQLLFK